MFRRRRSQHDFEAELQAHLQLEAERLRDAGMNVDDARSAARRQFGNLTHAGERFYESGRWGWADRLAQNLRFGLRMLARNPGSSALAILALSLGIGANTAIFSLFHAILLRPLPVDRPQDLVLFGKGEWNGSTDALPNRSWQLFSYPSFRRFRRDNQVFSEVAAVSSILFTTHGRVGSATTLEKLSAELVSGSYFDTLGVRPFLGRALTGDDDVQPGGHPVAVAGYSWWQRRLGADPSAVGHKIAIAGTIYTLVGVAPPGFSGITVGQSPDLWIPLAMQKQISPGWNGLEKNLFQSLYIFARRKPGIATAQASANVNLLFQQMLHAYAGPQPAARQLADIGRARIDLTPAATGVSPLRRRLAMPLRIVMGVVGIVLLIACANVANLLLARAATRRREIAIRLSIGAARSRLIQQLLIESALLAGIAAALGILMAWGSSRLLLAVTTTGNDAVSLNLAPDWTVLAFALAVTVATVLLFGMAPAFRATRLDLGPRLSEGRGNSAARSRTVFARSLIAAEIALSLALLSGAGLFLRSLANLLQVEAGFDKRNVLVTAVNPSAAGYANDDRLRNMMQRVEDRIAAIPGIPAAAFAFFTFNGGVWTDPVTVPSRPASPQDPEVTHDIVGAQYLRVMKMPVLLGRDLDAADTAASRHVAVINESMARMYFAGASPVGRTFSVSGNPSWQDIEVVGVVKDARYINLDERPRPAAFYPRAQRRGFFHTLVIRHSGDPRLLIPQIRQAVRDVDPNLPLGDFSTLSEVVDGSVARNRVVAQLTTVFAALAALLACVGIYGVMSYAIARRTNEIGIRMALGAQRSHVMRMVLRETMSIALVGAAAGLLLALACGRLVESILFGLRPYDPLVLAGSTVLIVFVALLAGWFPARRATCVDPTIALRTQ